jgi:hypothetical protein
MYMQPRVSTVSALRQDNSKEEIELICTSRSTHAITPCLNALSPGDFGPINALNAAHHVRARRKPPNDAEKNGHRHEQRRA